MFSVSEWLCRGVYMSNSNMHSLCILRRRDMRIVNVGHTNTLTFCFIRLWGNTNSWQHTIFFLGGYNLTGHFHLKKTWCLYHSECVFQFVEWFICSTRAKFEYKSVNKIHKNMFFRGTWVFHMQYCTGGFIIEATVNPSAQNMNTSRPRLSRPRPRLRPDQDPDQRTLTQTRPDQGSDRMKIAG